MALQTGQTLVQQGPREAISISRCTSVCKPQQVVPRCRAAVSAIARHRHFHVAHLRHQRFFVLVNLLAAILEFRFLLNQFLGAGQVVAGTSPLQIMDLLVERANDVGLLFQQHLEFSLPFEPGFLAGHGGVQGLVGLVEPIAQLGDFGPQQHQFLFAGTRLQVDIGAGGCGPVKIRFRIQDTQIRCDVAVELSRQIDGKSGRMRLAGH